MCLNYNLSIQETSFGPFMVHDASYAKGGSLSVEQQRGKSYLHGSIMKVLF